MEDEKENLVPQMYADAAEKMLKEPNSSEDLKPKRKRHPRRGSINCPICGTSLRSCFITLDKGGMRIIPSYVGCPLCKKIFQVALKDTEKIEIETKLTQ